MRASKSFHFRVDMALFDHCDICAGMIFETSDLTETMDQSRILAIVTV